MTFKHKKFDDSETMRSLVKVALDKGLIKEEPIVEMKKTASSNLEATGNLTQDIVTLCAGLRAEGFDKYAEEIESKFLAFKQAETLYETSKETGDDLVDAAHPEGSHKLEGLEHKVLTIVDRKKEIEKIVNKQPTGKFSLSKRIINSAKIALGQEPTSYSNQIQQYTSHIARLKTLINSQIQSAKQLYSSLDRKLKTYTSGDTSLEYTASQLFQSLDKDSRSAADFSKVQKLLKEVYEDLRPETYFGVQSGVEEDNWKDVSKLLIKISKHIGNANRSNEKLLQNEQTLEILKSKDEEEQEQEQELSLSYGSLKQSTNNLIKQIDDYSSNTKITKLPAWTSIFSKKLAAYKDAFVNLSNKYIRAIRRANQSEPENIPQIVQQWSDQFNKIYADFQKLTAEISKYGSSALLADDGLVSLNTLKAIRALKVSLAAGENITNTERSQYRIKYASKYKGTILKRISSLYQKAHLVDEELPDGHGTTYTSLKKAYDALNAETIDADKAKESLKSAILKISWHYRLAASNNEQDKATKQKADKDLIDSIEKIRRKVNTLVLLLGDAPINTIRGNIITKLDAYIKKKKAQQDASTLKEYQDSKRQLQALESQLKVFQNDPDLVSPSAKKWVNDTISEYNSALTNKYNHSDDILLSMPLQVRNSLFSRFKTYVSTEQTHVDSFIQALNDGKYKK